MEKISNDQNMETHNRVDTPTVILRINNDFKEQNSQNEYQEVFEQTPQYNQTNKKTNCTLFGCCKKTKIDQSSKYHQSNQLGSANTYYNPIMPDKHIIAKKDNKNTKCALFSCCPNNDKPLDIDHFMQIQPETQFEYTTPNFGKKFQVQIKSQMQAKHQFTIGQQQESQIQVENQLTIGQQQESQIQIEKRFITEQSAQEFQGDYTENKSLQIKYEEERCSQANSNYKNLDEEAKEKYKKNLRLEESLKDLHYKYRFELMIEKQNENQRQKEKQK